MELTNEFRVGVPVDDAWRVLTDVERIAPCLPGAQLTEVEGDVYRGTVKVKVGPITAQYAGTATFLERQDAEHRAVLRAEGRDTRGQGNANATVTATLTGEAGGTATLVSIVTDLTVTGKVAQFGRGVLADVSVKLIGQFVENLERDVLGSGGSAAPDESARSESARRESARPESGAADETVRREPPPSPVADHPSPAAHNGRDAFPAVRKIDSAEVAPVDLIATAGTPIIKRAAPLFGGIAALFILWRLLRRRSSGA